MKKMNQSPPSAIHQSLSTQQAREAHTEKAENPGPHLSPQRDNTVPLLLLLRNNRQRWAPQPQLLQPPPPAPAPPPSPPPLLPLPQFQQLLQHPLEKQPNLELTIALGTLWQPLYAGQAPGAHQAEEEAAEEEEDNQPPSPCSSSSPSQPSPTYALWERSPKSSRGKERKLTAS